ncbi:MAG: hypothetical protein E6J41_06965 [Chloroflexi bacterium]|nr:MAG: hypothetical protein E6J41_06965 [Chloroflexota bacterium]
MNQEADQVTPMDAPAGISSNRRRHAATAIGPAEWLARFRGAGAGGDPAVGGGGGCDRRAPATSGRGVDHVPVSDDQTGGFCP